MELKTWLIAIVFYFQWCYTLAGKVLLLSVQIRGHLHEMAVIGKELKRNGHDVYIVLDENLKDLPQFRGSGIKYLHYFSAEKNKTTLDLFGDSDSFVGGNVVGYFEAISLNRDTLTNDCSMALYDETLINQIKSIKFDIAIVDGLLHCYHLLPYVLDIPFVTISSIVFPYLTRMHPLLATRPCYIHGDSNTFLGRLRLFFGSILIEQLPKFFIKENEFIYYVKDKPFTSLYDVVAKSKLWFIKQNSFSDCPRPEMPNVIYIGGMTAGKANTLPQKFQHLLDSSKDGAILFTTGSSITKMPYNITKKFMSAFKMLKETIIWRLKDKDPKLPVPKNVKIFDWVPQNDILGHPNLKLFLTHCGNNAQNEALYNGVPMIGFPIFGDQFYNAERMVLKGYGAQMELQNFTPEELIEKIREVRKSKTYLQKVQRAAKLMKWHEHPLDKAANWVEYVIEFGDEDLKTAATNMNLIQFLMFDVFALFAVIVLILFFILKWFVVSIVKKVRSRFKKKISCTGKSTLHHSDHHGKKKLQ